MCFTVQVARLKRSTISSLESTIAIYTEQEKKKLAAKDALTCHSKRHTAAAIPTYQLDGYNSKKPLDQTNWGHY